MSEYRFLLKHSTIYGIGNILAKIVSFLMLPLYTRYLTPTDYGVLELIDVTTGMLGIVIGVGVAQAMGRFYYDSEDPVHRARVVGTIFLIVVGAAGAGFVALYPTTGLLAHLILDAEDYATLFVVSFASLALGMIIDVGQVYWRVTHRSTLYIAVSILNMVVAVSLNIVFVAVLEQGVLGILYAGLITRLVIGVPIVIIIVSKVGLHWDWPLAKGILQYALPLVPSQLANTVVNYSDRFFIKHFVSIQDAGIYGLANKLGTAIHMLITSPFIMAFQPRRFEIANRPDAPRILSKVFDYFQIVIVSTGLVLCVFIDEVMKVMTTPDYYRAGNLVPLIVLTMVIFSMRYHFEFGILQTKKTKYYMYINIVASVVHLLANLVLVRQLGLWGALYASLLAISLHSILIGIVGLRLFPIDIRFWKNAKLLLVAAGVYLLSRVVVADAVAVTVAYKLSLLAVFALSLRALDILDAKELAQLRRIPGEVLSRAPRSA